MTCQLFAPELKTEVCLAVWVARRAPVANQEQCSGLSPVGKGLIVSFSLTFAF